MYIDILSYSTAVITTDSSTVCYYGDMARRVSIPGTEKSTTTFKKRLLSVRGTGTGQEIPQICLVLSILG